MRSLWEQAFDAGIQVIVTTHSPILASAIDVADLVIVQKGRAFPLAPEYTELERSDYRFLQRFLDATKANLFFARGVVIVEGDAENILLPALARLVESDFTEHGVSVVNVGGVGLRRYARIFQRKFPDKDGALQIPVGCVTDMDVMPNCAPELIGLVEEGKEWQPTSKRRWKAKKDFTDEQALKSFRQTKEAKASGQSVKTFVSDEWTFEYDLALGPKNASGEHPINLAEEVFVAARLAEQDDAINSKTITRGDAEETAVQEFQALKNSAAARDGCENSEELASTIYAKFARDKVSKPVAAQYLAEILTSKREAGTLSPADLRMRLPKYLADAISYVTSGKAAATEVTISE